MDFARGPGEVPPLGVARYGQVVQAPEPAHVSDFGDSLPPGVDVATVDLGGQRDVIHHARILIPHHGAQLRRWRAEELREPELVVSAHDSACRADLFACFEIRHKDGATLAASFGLLSQMLGSLTCKAVRAARINIVGIKIQYHFKFFNFKEQSSASSNSTVRRKIKEENEDRLAAVCHSRFGDVLIRVD